MAFLFLNSCLLIVDFQDFFTDRRSRGYVKGAAGVKPELKKLIRGFLHKGLPVFATRHFNIEDETDPFFKFYGKVIGQEDPGFELSPPVSEFRKIEVFEKSGYSPFLSAPLLKWLRKRKVKNIYLTGALLEKCILAASFDAFQRGFDVFVVKDCVLSRKRRLKKNALEIIARSCGKIVSTKQVLKNEGR